MRLRGDNIDIDVSGALQGRTTLIFNRQNIDNLTVTIAEGAYVVARDERSVDIDGDGSSVASNSTITNAGTIYAAEQYALQAGYMEDTIVTNTQTGLITAADRAAIFNYSDNVTFYNDGSVITNDDNITYRGNITVARVPTQDGYGVTGYSAANFTLENEGNIQTNGGRALYFKLATDSTFSNTGTISADGINALQFDRASNIIFTNSGTIIGTEDVLYGDELDDSVFTNQDNATFTATNGTALYLRDADNTSFINHDSLVSDNGTVVDTQSATSASITNTGTIKTTATGTNYVLIGDNTVLTNHATGTITSTAGGLSLDDGNEFKNYGSLSVGDNFTAVTFTGDNNIVRLYDGATISGTISGNTGTTGNILAVENDVARTLSDNISGAVGLTKTGDATLTLTQTQSYTGATTISEGTFALNGTIANSTVTVASDGTMKGTGSAGGIINNGTLAPGNSIGSLSVSGDVTLNDNSTLEIEVTGNGSSDRLIATGTVTANGRLKLIPTKQTAFGAVETYRIIDAGTATGTFDTVSARACGAAIETSYNADEILVTLTGCFGKKSKAVDKLQNYINNLYDSKPSVDLQTVLTELEGLSGSDYETALGKLDTDAGMAIATTASQGLRSVSNLISQRSSARGGASAVQQKLAVVTASDPLGSDSRLSIKKRLQEIGRKGMWVKGFSGYGDKKAIKDVGVNGYDYDFTGTVIGFDLPTETITQGLALSLQNGAVKTNGGEVKQDYETVSLTYQNTQTFKDDYQLSLSAGLASTKVAKQRHITIGAIDRTARSNYRSYALELEADYSLPSIRLGALRNDLNLSMGVNYNSQEKYNETGAGALNLEVDPHHTAQVRFGLANTLYWDGNQGDDAMVIPFLSTALYGSRYLNDNAIKQALAGASKVEVDTDRAYDIYGTLGLGLIAIQENDNELRLMTQTKFSDKLKEYSASLNYGIKF